MALKIGLEIHGYLVTKEKLFCDCKNEHKNKDSSPNTFICPTCTGQPGSKPMLPNQEAIHKLIQIALMLNCKVNHLPKEMIWYRKHYNWPDLPKGYQNTISGTYAVPVGEKGEFLGIGITEVHLEEDPAAWDPETGEIDYNRSGAPLVEIVTDPDFKSLEQVEEWLKQLTLTLSYIQALDSDAGIKADVNVSTTGDRVEIKNMNSIAEIKKAIAYEIKRQEKEKVEKKETRQWNSEKGMTIKMREKESHADYRFIKDPDLPVIQIKKQEVEEIKFKLPESPLVKLEKLIKKHKVEPNYAKILTSNLELVELFEEIIEKNQVSSRLVVPWVTVELLGMLNYNKKNLNEVKINPEHFIQLLKLIEEGKLTELKAKDVLRTWKNNSHPVDIKGETKIESTKELESFIEKAIKENEKAWQDYKSGNQQALNFIIGAVMKISNKRADYQTVKKLLEKK
jgi:aspartyl-tRNA(Asn)/glutamyl-tRNA(Gln) amidotransferase subunit B